MKQIKVAVGVLVADRDGIPQVLIARRPVGTVFTGFWELPGGKVKPGETLNGCLEREFREELGLTIRVGAVLRTVEHVYDYGQVRLHAFLCTRVDGEPLDLQVAEHRWIRPSELRQYQFPPANAELIVAIEAALDSSVRNRF